MLERFPFSYRVALLLGLMIVAAAIDVWRRGPNATRPREYAFIWIAGLLGGLVGLANDCVTSSLSPDYFILGKGLGAGDGLRWRAGVYGFKAGLSAGIIGGAICLVARPRNSGFSTEQMRRALLALWMPVAGAVLVGVTLPIFAGRFDPMHLSARVDSLLNADQTARFLRVWWIQTGLYAGMVLGLAAMIVRQRVCWTHQMSLL
jgi:hypothetical protein